eukprot:GHRR01017911.1.p2 GENE.GHRR01017911.1~~GHRR01017911.1.p2  ORF type:complete len:113 (-),score=60.69 GHRR01017911.1:181-519(-)
MCLAMVGHPPTGPVHFSPAKHRHGGLDLQVSAVHSLYVLHSSVAPGGQPLARQQQLHMCKLNRRSGGSSRQQQAAAGIKGSSGSSGSSAGQATYKQQILPAALEAGLMVLAG